jgi:hypothetical protein
MGKCWWQYKGRDCACQGCNHEDGFCVDDPCAVCEGPVKKRCDLSEEAAEYESKEYQEMISNGK